jgi:hypothetical protein
MNVKFLATLLLVAGLAVAPATRAANLVTGQCETRPAAGSTLNLCDFTPAANGETLGMATFEVVNNGLVSIHFSLVDGSDEFLEMALQIVLPSGPVTSLLTGEGFLQFQGVAGTRYSALIHLLPGESGFGMAHMLVSQSAVPLPPSVLLLASALLAGWRLSRRRLATATFDYPSLTPFRRCTTS